MICRSRLEIYASSDVKQRAVIAGEKSALTALAEAILKAANGAAGFHSVNLFKGNGHDYEILITKNVEEEEWQSMPESADHINFVKDLDAVKSAV